MRLIPTASQTIGPFFRHALERPAWSDLTREGAQGEAIHIEGVVRDGDGAPVPDALLEIWQPNAAGRYAHPEDQRPVQLDRLFRGFGRACTDRDGVYWFRTVMPGAGEHGGAPHVNVSIFARGLLARLVTRIYFADREDENARDPLLVSIADEAVRRTLIAPRTTHASGIASYRFDVVLQGDGETAFLTV